MKAALYMRCSTDMQEMSIPDQRKILRRYCDEKGYEIVEEFADEGISGTTFDKRPGITKLFQKVQSKQHNFTKLVILNESRFGRSPNNKEPLHFEYVLERDGVILEYAQSDSNLPGIAGTIQRLVKYDQSGEFSKQLSKDVIRGHSTAAGKGYSTGGLPPLGYAHMVCDENGKELYTLELGQRKGIKNHWVKCVPGDPRDVALVNRIFRLYAEGSKGYREICHTLNDEGIPSPRGGFWGVDTIRSILINRKYIGERSYGGTKWSKKVKEKAGCPKAHEAIVPLALFEKVQSQRGSRPFSKCNGMRTDYLLSGKIVCMSCNHKFQGRKVKNGFGKTYHYYVDSGYKNYRACQPLNIPKNNEGKIAGIEDFVISQIEKMLDSEKYVERFKTHLKDALIRLERESSSAYPVLKNKLKGIDDEIVKIQNALIYTEAKSKSLADRLLQKEAERDDLLKEIKRHEGVRNQPSQILALVNEYARVLKNVGEILKKREPGEQKTAIGYFLDRIEVLRKEGVARCYFYDTPQTKEADYSLPGVSKSVYLKYGAEGGNRTPMELPPLDPEPSVSTSSTTSALGWFARKTNLIYTKISQESRVRSQKLKSKMREQEKVKSYRDLIVWQKAHELVKEVIDACASFPLTEEAKIIKRQLLRSSTSIPANIAEGYGGNKGKVFQNSLTIARREVTETDYWLLLSFELGYLKEAVYKEVEKGYQEVRAMLSSFIFKLEKASDS